MDGEGGTVDLDEEMEGREGDDVSWGVKEVGVWDEAQEVGGAWDGEGGGVCVEEGGGACSVEDGRGAVRSAAVASVFGSVLCLPKEEEVGGGGRSGIWGVESISLGSDWSCKSKESSCATT